MLNIFRASAGSGKTFRLTAEYISLLFETNKQPHRNILAVTFTNKATDEMKSRILIELNKLATGKDSAHLEKLTKRFLLTEDEVRNKAKNILINILHDYSRFSVSTIDRFFQQVIRSFAREIGLQGGYNVELDKDKILSAAVDKMIYELDKTEHKQLLGWLTKFSEERIESGKSWNIHNDIKSLADEIFKEKYKNFSNAISEKLQDKDFIKTYMAELNAIKKEFESNMKSLAEKALKIIAEHHLQTTDFKGGSRTAFNKLVKIKSGDIEELTATFIALPNNLDNWYTLKKTPKEIINSIENAYNKGLNSCIEEIVSFHQEHIMHYLSIKYITRNLYTLGILADIDNQVKTYLEEKNLMMLSDSNSLLNKIIDDSDAPFVYEKTGVYINHFMIDEFQDTSGMQWANFYPLVKNSLAQNNENLIVGDVKQSIYRWRNSDWKLLDEQLDIDFRPEEINHEVLDTNWRSDKNIVDFNNAFFCIAANVLQQALNNDIPEQQKTNENIKNLSNKISGAYKKMYQKLPDNKANGHVKIEFIPNNKGKDEEGWKETVLSKLPEVFNRLQDNHFKLKDIAILVRTKDEGKMIANYLLEYKERNPSEKYQYDIISDEALLISNANSVQFILSLLRHFINTEDSINKAVVAFEYLTNIEGIKPEEALRNYFSTHKNDKSLLESVFNNETNSRLESIKHLSLFEMIEEMIDLFKLGEKETDSIFLQAFQDTVFDFINSNNADIDSFLKWWDTNGFKKTISTPEDQNAIRIITIHKSKGLDFEAVIIPFCEWSLDQKQGNILWCEPKMPPYNQLNIIPIPYSTKLKDTIFYEDYMEEKMHSYIDNLNVAYVAFTRAKKQMIAFAPEPKKENASQSIASLMHFCFQNANNFSLTSDDGNAIINLTEKWEDKNLLFQNGEFEPLLKKEEIKTKEEIKLNTYISQKSNNRLRLRLHSTDYFGEGERKINYGTIMHELLNKIEVSEDIQNAIAEMIHAGKISKKESEDVKNKMRDFLDIPVVKEWFSGKYKVLNEIDIITPEGNLYRPDRVLIENKNAIIIDYKFGEKEDKKYNKQVKNYMQLIEEMDYNTTGYICYVELGKIEEVA